MKPDRAWVRLQSGKRLDLLDPDMAAWEDRDLAIGLSRTYRWGGHSRWDLPLSVAQHSLLVLVLRQQMQPHALLDRDDALRELLQDGHEGFLSFDPIARVKPHLGPDFEDVANRLQAAIGHRYGLPAWKGDDHVLHKGADRLAAASEALHVAGWSRHDLIETLGIELAPVMADPLPRLDGLRPWEPWPAKLAAALFLAKLRELTDNETQLDHPAALEAAVEASWPQCLPCHPRPQRTLLGHRRVVDHQERVLPAHQPVSLACQHLPQRPVIPRRVGDEVLQLIVPGQPQPLGHGKQALALAQPQQAAQVERRPPPPRLAAHHPQERLQPPVQIVQTDAARRHGRPPKSPVYGEETHHHTRSAQVVLVRDLWASQVTLAICLLEQKDRFTPPAPP